MRIAIPSPVMPHTPLLSLATSARHGPLEHRSQRTPPIQKGQRWSGLPPIPWASYLSQQNCIQSHSENQVLPAGFNQSLIGFSNGVPMRVRTPFRRSGLQIEPENLPSLSLFHLYIWCVSIPVRGLVPSSPKFHQLADTGS